MADELETVLIEILIEIRADVREIRDAQRTDFRWLMTVWISGMAALLAVMAHGFHWI